MTEPTYKSLEELQKAVGHEEVSDEDAKLLIQDGVIEAIDNKGNLLYRSYSPEAVLAEALELLGIPWGRVKE